MLDSSGGRQFLLHVDQLSFRRKCSAYRYRCQTRKQNHKPYGFGVNSGGPDPLVFKDNQNAEDYQWPRRDATN